jgi:hypothetical protein
MLTVCLSVDPIFLCSIRVIIACSFPHSCGAFLSVPEKYMSLTTLDLILLHNIVYLIFIHFLGCGIPVSNMLQTQTSKTP